MPKGALQDTSPRFVDPVLSSFVEDFAAHTEVLKNARGDDHREAAKGLCELSREIRFRLGPPSDGSPELVAEIVRLFRGAVAAMNVPNDDEEFEAFRTNIRDRADIIQRGG